MFCLSRFLLLHNSPQPDWDVLSQVLADSVTSKWFGLRPWPEVSRTSQFYPTAFKLNPRPFLEVRVENDKQTNRVEIEKIDVKRENYSVKGRELWKAGGSRFFGAHFCQSFLT